MHFRKTIFIAFLFLSTLGNFCSLSAVLDEEKKGSSTFTKIANCLFGGCYEGWVEFFDPAENYTREGNHHLHGFSGRKDVKKAAKLFKIAANRSNGRGQTNLGYMYQNGFGVNKNNKKAVKFYTQAANQGNRCGQYNLGYMYEHGLGVEKDYKKALELYKGAAHQGHAEAQVELGCIYQYCLGVERDYKKALECYTNTVHFSP